MAQSARELAVTALMQWEREQTYSNIAVDALLKSQALSPQEAALTTRLIYGVIERCLTLDWLLEKCSRRPLKKCHPAVRAVLRVGAYQIVFMDKIPVSAAVNEAVAAVKDRRQAYAAAFVNGVLRTLANEHTRLIASLSTDLKGTSVRCSVPLPLLQLWANSYGREMACRLAESINDAPPSVVRVNTLQTTVDAFVQRLRENGIACHPFGGLPQALVVEDAAALGRCRAIPPTTYYFQDGASQWACAALLPQAGERVLDVCAAPGGKSLTVAQQMGDCGEIIACDIYENKVSALRQRAKALGITSLQATVRDAASPLPADWAGAFDRVICDVPCSGFGAVRRKPEIRYKQPEEFSSLPALQYAILCRNAEAVKAGGVLQYSTCTLSRAENEEVAERFLAQHPAFRPRPLPIAAAFEAAGLSPSHQITLLPPIHGTDGFFIASFQKEAQP